MMVTPKAVCSTVARAGARGCGGGPPKGAATTMMRGSPLAPPVAKSPPPSATGAPKPPSNPIDVGKMPPLKKKGFDERKSGFATKGLVETNGIVWAKGLVATKGVVEKKNREPKIKGS